MTPLSANPSPAIGWVLYAGQSVGLVREVLPAAEIVARLLEEAEATLRSQLIT